MATRTKTKPVAGFDPAVPLQKIHQHPKNPRRDATASEDLVASVKAQGLMQALVLAPHPDIEGEYVLIAGHRRRDALVQAGAKTAKAEIRVDLVTDVQQIEAMLIENSGRSDLTAIEEAEAYEQLQLFNIKPADIARAVGQSRQRVSSRLKLLTLDPASRTKVHAGQVTIDDALQLVDLPKAAREELEPLLGGGDFRYKLGIQKDRLAHLERFKADVKVAQELGVPSYSDEPVDTWALQRDGVVLRMHCGANDATIVTALNDHPDCLRWCENPNHAGIPFLVFVCADPDSHVDENAEPSTSVDAERETREAHYAEMRAQLEAEQEKRRVADRLRWETLAAANPATVLRSFLPGYLWSLESIGVSIPAEFSEHLGIDHGESAAYDQNAPYWQSVMAALDKASDDDVLRAVVALTVGEIAGAAAELVTDGDGENLLIAHAFDGLRALGHDFNEVDTALEAAALGRHGDEGGDDE